jgi:hypothetical protein
VVVGAYYDDTGAGNSGSAYVYELTSLTPTVPWTTITNPGPATSDQFGFAVAISGTTVLVGADSDDLRTTNEGNAYVYLLAGSTPTVPVAALNHPSLKSSDFFGYSVAVSGTRLVAGAYGDDSGTNDAGSAYVYDLAGANPTVPVLRLANPSAAAGDRFGFAVAVSGARVVVGAYRDDTGASDAGSVYVYDLAGATPAVPVTILTNPSPTAGDLFGYAVAISGPRVVVGANADDIGAVDAGSVFVYDMAGTTPTVPVLTLTNPSPAISDYFGSSLAISGTRVIVGAYQDDTGAANSGTAYVFDLANVTPTVPVATLSNPSPAASDYFGESVAISGTRAVVGAWSDDTGAANAGSAYAYDLASATPTVAVATLTNPAPAVNDNFGYSVAISGTLVVVGAVNEGSAYVYDLAGATPTAPVAALTNPSPAPSDFFGNAVAIDGEVVAVTAYSDDTAAPDAGAVYLYGRVPALAIDPAEPGFATIWWPPSLSTGLVLQYTDAIASQQWLNAPSGGTNPATIPLTNSMRFFRLFKP